MYKKENLKMKELKKLFYDYSFIKDPMSVKKILEILNGSNDKEKSEAMRHILCRMQNKEDMDCVFNDVVKIIDTRDVNLKRLTNMYLKVYTKDKTIRQLLCVNTFLKDLSDKSDEIKKAALETIGFIGDEVVLTNYKNRLKNMTNEKRDVQLCLIGTLGRLPDSLCLGEILRNYVYSDDLQLSALALEKLSVKGTFLEDDEILELLKRKENDLKTCYFLVKMAYKRNMQIDVSKLLKKDYLPLFYYTSSILLRNDSSNKQMVYDASLLFMKSTYEKVYHILLFQESLLDYVNYENSTYLIYEDDPFYIKIQKVKMLFFRLDDVSIYELSRHSKGVLAETILEYGLKKNFVILDIFSNVDINNNVDNNLFHSESNLIDILFNNYPFSNNYSYLIRRYLIKTSPSLYNSDTIKKYLYLAGNICEEKPLVMDEIEEKADTTMAYDIMKFYLNFFKRQIITEEQLIETLCTLKKREKLKEKAKLLLNVINFKGPYVLFDFAENQIKEISKYEQINLEINEEKETKNDLKSGLNEVNDSKNDLNEVNDSKNDLNDPILTTNPYDNSSNILPIKAEEYISPTKAEEYILPTKAEDCLYISSPLPFINSTNEKEEWSNKTIHSYSPSGDVIVDSKHLKGTLFLTKNEIKLEVDILEKPLNLSCGIETIEEFFIEREETFCLWKAKLSDVGKTFRIVVSNAVFEILINRNKLILPNKCTQEEHEKAFKSINTYKITDKLNESSVYVIDDNSFSFQILSRVVYGKNFCDQVVLKGDKDVLEIF